MTKSQIERKCLETVINGYKKKEEIYFNALINLRKTDKAFKDLDDNARYRELEYAKNPSAENKQKLDLARQIQKQYLATKGVFEPEHICKKCLDTGFVNGHKCTCLANLISNELTKQSGISLLNIKTFADCNFEIFNPKHRETAKKLYNFFDKEIKNFNTTNKLNYVVCGKCGAGKTFLFSAIAGELLKNEHSTLFLTSFSLNDAFLRYHTTFSEEKLTILAPILDCEALLIDDLGTEQILNNVTIPYLLMVLKERHLAGKKTFINTNLMPDKINEIYGERIYSRLFDKTCSIAINFENDNLRI